MSLQEEVLQWLGRRKYPRVYAFEGLPTRVVTALTCADLTTRQQVREAVESGKLHPSCTTNYGKVAHKEVCEWLGIAPPTGMVGKPNLDVVERYTKYLEKFGYRVIAPEE